MFVSTHHVIDPNYYLMRNSTMGLQYFLTFPACFSIPIIFSNFDFNCSNLSSLRNLQEQVKKAFCYQELFWPFTVWINCSSDLKNFENSRPSASNFKSFSWSLEQFFLTGGQNNFGNKIPYLWTILFNFGWCIFKHYRKKWLSKPSNFSCDKGYKVFLWVNFNQAKGRSQTTLTRRGR